MVPDFECVAFQVGTGDGGPPDSLCLQPPKHLKMVLSSCSLGSSINLNFYCQSVFYSSILKQLHIHELNVINSFTLIDLSLYCFLTSDLVNLFK